MLEQLFNEIENLINENKISEADDLVKYIQTFQLNYEQGKILHSYKSKLTSLKRNSISISTINNSNNNGLITNNKQQFEKRISLLKESVNTLVETEIIGNDTIKNLEKQEEQIKNQTSKTIQINNNLNNSNKLITKMSNWWRN